VKGAGHIEYRDLLLESDLFVFLRVLRDLVIFSVAVEENESTI